MAGGKMSKEAQVKLGISTMKDKGIGLCKLASIQVFTILDDCLDDR